MGRRSSIAAVAAIAQAQLGLITRRQAELAGVAPATLGRQVAEGVLFGRIAHGVYIVAGAPEREHLELRAAWLQLAPETPAWERTPEQGVVSHRAAAAIYGLGDVPADRHQFTLHDRSRLAAPRCPHSSWHARARHMEADPRPAGHHSGPDRRRPAGGLRRPGISRPRRP
ncbi:MAG: type IV toxin-antitoxin system AbiEi family antitoxin domain-containing protein [Actinomycetota bacterium]|nr:type IV toxin-antitoxin system AbiEi family antitoxin domain-containing protein [Actinomycetota bacterium]